MSNFLSDIAALAKAGYTPAEIKELLQLSATSSSTSISDDTTPVAPSAGDSAPDQKIEEPIKNENQENEKDTSSGDTEKYNAKVADLEKEINDLKEKLSKAQKENQRSNMADAENEKSANTILAELATSYM